MSRRYLGWVPRAARITVAPAQKPATPAVLGLRTRRSLGYDRGGSACHVTPLPRKMPRPTREVVAPAQKPATSAVLGLRPGRVGVPCHAAT
ncbi:MAG: hypothetical protein KGZ50_01200 [Peptococcaceae bacterium]|nr:hypothetical protein [Peptococcaceae bacterium]